MTPRSISFVVHGTPKPKGSARGFVAMKDGKARAIVVADNTKSLKSWEAAVRFAAQGVAGDALFEGAIALHLQFYLQRPASISEKKRPFMTTKPDLSKLIRGLEDALNEVIWKDDALVVAITASKLYAAPGESSRAFVTVTEVLPLSAPLPTHAPLLEGMQSHV